MESDTESVISEYEVFVDPSHVQEEIILDDKDRDNLDLDEDMDDDPTSDAQDSTAPPPQDDSIVSFSGHTDSVYSVSLHPSNEYAVTGGGDDRAFLWNVKDGTTIFELTGHKDTVSQANFNFDGKLIATGSYDGTVKIWDVPTGKMLANLEGPSDLIETIAWHPKGNAILAGSQDCTIWMWMASGAFMNMFSGHKGSVSVVTFSADGKHVLSGSEDGAVRVWDPKNASAVATLEGYGFHEGGPITSLATHATNASVILTGSQDSTVCMSNISTGKPLGMLKNHNDTVESVAFSNGFPWFASGSLDKTVSVFDANTLQQRGVCNHDDGVVKVQWHPTQPLFYSSSTDKTVRLWDARSGEAVRVWRGHKDTILDFALSSDGSFVVTAGDDQASLVFKV